jgi:hypothetical protein
LVSPLSYQAISLSDKFRVFSRPSRKKKPGKPDGGKRGIGEPEKKPFLSLSPFHRFVSNIPVFVE